MSVYGMGRKVKQGRCVGVMDACYFIYTCTGQALR